MATLTNQADELQGQMRQVRYELGDNVQGIVENARLMTDWQYYVRTYPLVCLGVAAAVGYLVVPSRVEIIKPDPKALVELAKAKQISVHANIEPKSSAGIMNRLVNMAAGMLLQGGLALLSGQLHQLLDRSLRQRDSSRQEKGGGEHEESHH